MHLEHLECGTWRTWRTVGSLRYVTSVTAPGRIIGHRPLQVKVVGAPFHGVRAREKCLPQLEPSAAGQLAGGENARIDFARERRTPASRSTPASQPFAFGFSKADAEVRVLCCAAARPFRRPGVDSFEVDSAGAHRPCGLSGCTVDSAGTMRPPCAAIPSIAMHFGAARWVTAPAFVRSTPEGPCREVKPIASIDARWVWTRAEASVSRARHAVSLAVRSCHVSRLALVQY